MLVLTKSHDFFSFGPVADILGWIMEFVVPLYQYVWYYEHRSEHYFVYVSNQIDFIPTDH